MGEFSEVVKLEFLVKSSKNILQLTTFSRQKDETFKVLYTKLLKLKENTQSITNLEVVHRYLRSLESTMTLHAQVLQRVFVEFGDSYTLLHVYNISKKLELAHAHYEANTMRSPSHSRPQLSWVAPTKSSHSSSRAKVVQSATPILPSCNYYGKLAHKANECNIPSEDVFCHYCGKEGHQETICFSKFLEWKQLWLLWQNLRTSCVVPQPKAKAPHPPLRLSPPMVIPIRMLKRSSTMWQEGGALSPCHLSSNFAKWTWIIEGQTC